MRKGKVMDWDASDVVPALLLAALIALVLTPYTAQWRAAFMFFDFVQGGF
ncbi:MAG: hypothetical protein OJF48_003425 [Afipia sp.]|jgi:hypothetical protein|nr:MAG: hypothetical protein OJF48_003425 [Afipia sp.]